jgi:simple sugar transport system permease protein
MMGRGWIVLALTIFSLWSPLGSLIGAYLFGGEVLQFHLQEYGVLVSLLGTLPYVYTISASRQLTRLVKKKARHTV